jgi:hypothetical protein
MSCLTIVAEKEIITVSVNGQIKTPTTLITPPELVLINL